MASKSNVEKVLKEKLSKGFSIDLCPVCGGTGTVFRPPEDFYEKMHEKGYTHKQFYFPCKKCKGTGITNSELLTGKSHIEFIKSAHGIFSDLIKKKIKIAEKLINGQKVGYDVWAQKDDKMKKLTRGRKYLVAPNLAVAVRQLLEAGEYTSNWTAHVILVNGKHGKKTKKIMSLKKMRYV